MANAESLKDLRAVIGGSRRDPHLRHDLENPRVDGLNVALNHLAGVHVIEVAFGVQRVQSLQRQIRMDRVCAEPDQTGNLMHIACVAAVRDNRRRQSLPAIDQVMMNGGDRKQHGNRNAIRADFFVAQDDQRVSVLDGVVNVIAERVKRRLKP